MFFSQQSSGKHLIHFLICCSRGADVSARVSRRDSSLIQVQGMVISRRFSNPAGFFHWSLAWHSKNKSRPSCLYGSKNITQRSGITQDHRLDETLKAFLKRSAQTTSTTTTTTTSAPPSDAQDSNPSILKHATSNTTARSPAAMHTNTVNATSTDKQPLPKLRHFRPRSAAAQPQQPQAGGRDAPLRTMIPGASAGTDGAKRQSAYLPLAGGCDGGGGGGVVDAMGAATGAVLERSAALRMALQVRCIVGVP
eukprot:1160321-Pelagomonas_calceolata.AAC.3